MNSANKKTISYYVLDRMFFYLSEICIRCFRALRFKLARFSLVLLLFRNLFQSLYIYMKIKFLLPIAGT